MSDWHQANQNRSIRWGARTLQRQQVRTSTFIKDDKKKYDFLIPIPILFYSYFNASHFTVPFQFWPCCLWSVIAPKRIEVLGVIRSHFSSSIWFMSKSQKSVKKKPSYGGVSKLSHFICAALYIKGGQQSKHNFFILYSFSEHFSKVFYLQCGADKVGRFTNTPITWLFLHRFLTFWDESYRAGKMQANDTKHFKIGQFV